MEQALKTNRDLKTYLSRIMIKKKLLGEKKIHTRCHTSVQHLSAILELETM